MTELTKLADCPTGLFMYAGELCLKTEYGNNEGRIDAYIVSSGEFFWGDHPQTIANQRAQLVEPVELYTILTALRDLDKAREALREVVACMLRGGDGQIGDYGWNISRLTAARPLIRAALGEPHG